MTELWLSVAAAVIFVAVVACKMWSPLARSERHARCLRNIARLERELWPESFPDPRDVRMLHRRELERVLFYGK